MRHGDKNNNLSRTKSHRDSMLANLGSQLIIHKRIVTTLAKAKVLRTFLEPLITKTKKSDDAAQIMHQHRLVFSHLRNKHAVKELFTVVGPKVASRPGGYTRIIKLGTRPGDNAELAMIELVDFNEVYSKGTAAKTEPAKRTRRGRGGKKAATPTPAEDTTVAETAAQTAETPESAETASEQNEEKASAE